VNDAPSRLLVSIMHVLIKVTCVYNACPEQKRTGPSAQARSLKYSAPRRAWSDLVHPRTSSRMPRLTSRAEAVDVSQMVQSRSELNALCESDRTAVRAVVRFDASHSSADNNSSTATSSSIVR
jgi:hypothetical protein